MATSPVVEWRAAITPFATLSSVSLTGTGFNGAVPVGTSSSVTTVRVYNNFLAAGGVADALNCVIAVYDDAVHQGLALTLPTTKAYTSVQVQDYNGVTTGADTVYFGIGGSKKHAVPTNSGTISGTGNNYVTLNVEVVVPANATQGSISQGIWLEYSSTS